MEKLTERRKCGIADKWTFKRGGRILRSCRTGRVDFSLRVISNFGDSGEIHARARKWVHARRRATRRGAENWRISSREPISAHALVFRGNREN